MENETIIDEQDKKAYDLYRKYENDIMEAIEASTLRDYANMNNMIIARIRDKNRAFNKDIEKLQMPWLKDFFIKNIKEEYLKIESLPDSLKDALKYL